MRDVHASAAEDARQWRRYDPCESPPSHFDKASTDMSKLLRGLAAGYGAKRLGGGCFSTVIIFLILWWLLGHFGVFK
jgi:hypothetical protein